MVRAHRRGVRRAQGLGDRVPPAGSNPGCSLGEEGGRRGLAGWLAPSDGGSGVPGSPWGQFLATSHFLILEHVRAQPAPLLPGAVHSVPPASSFLFWGLRVTGWGSGARVPRWPRLAQFQRGAGAAASLSGVPRAQASEGCSPDCAPVPCWGERGCLLSRPSRPYVSQDPHPVVPCCWESRWWPRVARRAAQTTASPQRCDSSPVTAQGVARGGWTCRTGSGPLPSRPAAHNREVLGNRQQRAARRQGWK